MSISQDKLTIQLKEKSFGFIGKLYVWSIILEPLLLFVVTSQDVSGVGGNISRLLQFIVICCLIISLLLKTYNSIRIFNPFHSYFRWYIFYFLFLIFSFIYGYFIGAYEVNKEGINSSSLLNNSIVRPVFEYFIAMYYFIYFAVLPFFILRSKKGIDYFFKVFFFMFFLSFFLGTIDLFLILFTGYEFIPRHLSDFTHVGQRFHGLAGEPRDAFVYLFFGIALLYLREIWTGVKFNRIWLLLILVAALLTQSTSGFLGLGMSVALILVYQVPRMKLSSALLVVFSAFALLTVVLSVILNSPRILLYIDAAPLAMNALEKGLELPPLIMYQVNNIYPLWMRWTEIIQMNILPLFMGTGLGTASITNGYILTEGGVLNPHANIIRIVYEGGLIGTLLYIAAFLQPVRNLSKTLFKPSYILIPMLLMIGVSFGHRSSTLFIFLGISILVIHYKEILLKYKENKNGS